MDTTVHCRIPNSPPLIPIQSQTNPVHAHPSSFTEIISLILTSHLRLGIPRDIFLSRLPTKILDAFLYSTIKWHSNLSI